MYYHSHGAILHSVINMDLDMASCSHIITVTYFRYFRSKSRIFNWVQKFREYGTVQNLNSNGLRDTSGQRVSARTERNIDAVWDSVGWSPKKSL